MHGERRRAATCGVLPCALHPSLPQGDRRTASIMGKSEWGVLLRSRADTHRLMAVLLEHNALSSRQASLSNEELAQEADEASDEGTRVGAGGGDRRRRRQRSTPRRRHGPPCKGSASCQSCRRAPSRHPTPSPPHSLQVGCSLEVKCALRFKGHVWIALGNSGGEKLTSAFLRKRLPDATIQWPFVKVGALSLLVACACFVPAGLPVGSDWACAATPAVHPPARCPPARSAPPPHASA